MVVASLTRVSRSIRPNWRLCSPPPGDSEREQFGAITRVDRTTVSVISSSEIRLGHIVLLAKYAFRGNISAYLPLRKTSAKERLEHSVRRTRSGLSSK